MGSKSDNIEIMMNDEVDELIEEPFQSLKKRYQNKSEESIKGSDFVFGLLIYCIINVIK